jgi:hypothetical protein
MTTEGRHTNPELMKVTLPDGYTPAYWLAGRETYGITVPTVQPGLVDGNNEWLVTGVRHRLERFANEVAHMHFSCASPVH